MRNRKQMDDEAMFAQIPLLNIINTVEHELNNETVKKLKKSFIAFDVETTGLYPEDDVIIELGAVKFVNGEVVDSYGTLVDEGKPVPYEAYRVNNISTEMLREQGKDAKLAYKELTDFLGDALRGDTFIVAHNANFDLAFLSKALEKYGYGGLIRYVDTLNFAKQQISDLANYKQGTLAKYFDLVNEEAHRAVADAETCGKICTCLLSKSK